MNDVMPPIGDRQSRPSTLARVLWIVVPLIGAVVGIEVGSLTLTDGREPLLSIGEIACGVALVLVVARALLRKR